MRDGWAEYPLAKAGGGLSPTWCMPTSCPAMPMPFFVKFHLQSTRLRAQRRPGPTYPTALCCRIQRAVCIFAAPGSSSEGHRLNASSSGSSCTLQPAPSCASAEAETLAHGAKQLVASKGCPHSTQSLPRGIVSISVPCDVRPSSKQEQIWEHRKLHCMSFAAHFHPHGGTHRKHHLSFVPK